jgi:esterase
MSAVLSSAEIGSGRPIIILHGLFGWKRNWTSIAKALSDDYRVFTLDLRNHGESQHIDGMSYEDMAADISCFIKSNNLGPVPVVGHSMGGKASMILALTEPELIERLLVLDIAPIPYDRDYDDYIAILHGIDLSTITRRSEVDQAFEQAFPDRSIRAFLLQNLATDGQGSFRWRVNLDAIDNHMDDIMGFPDIDSDQAFEGQTLFLAGGNSDYVTQNHQAEIDRLFPNAELDFIDDAGHWVHAEQPDAFVERLKTFLSS